MEQLSIMGKVSLEIVENILPVDFLVNVFTHSIQMSLKG